MIGALIGVLILLVIRLLVIIRVWSPDAGHDL